LSSSQEGLGAERPCSHGSEAVSSYSVSYENIKANKIAGVYLDGPCGLLVRVPGYRSRGPGSIPGATRSAGSGTGSTQPLEYN
jgi:hypothetical protein